MTSQTQMLGEEAPLSSSVRYSEKVFVPLMLLAGPIVLSMLLQMANSFVETMMASRSGMQMLGIISVGTLIEALPTAFVSGLVYAVVPAVSRMKGVGATASIMPFLCQAIVVSVGISLVFGALIVVFSESAMIISGVTPDLADGVRTYLYFVPLFILGNVLFLLGRNFAEAFSYPLLVTASVLAGLGVKTLVIYAIVLGHFGFPQMGVVGFALSSVAYYSTINVILLVFSLWQHEIRLIWKTPVGLEDCSARKLLFFTKSGLPVAFNFVSDLFILSIMGVSISSLGVQSIGAHSLAFNILGIALVGTGGMAMAASILIARSSGSMDSRGLIAMAAKCLIVSLLLMLMPALLLGFYPEPILQLYDPDAALLPLARQLAQLLPWLLMILTTTTVAAFLLRGLDDGVAVMLIYLVVSWLVWLPFGYVLAFTDILVPRMGAAGWWYAYLLSQCFLAIVLCARLSWVLRRIDNRVPETVVVKVV